MSGAAQVKVSVVIRNRNEADHLRHVLQALGIQDRPPDEIIIVDNESTDESHELYRQHQHKLKVETINKADFTYGRALNQGIRSSQGDFIIILSAHSLPLGRHFISDCLEPFADETIAAVRCVYVGRAPDAFRWLEPEILTDSPETDWVGKGPLASGCAIRRSVWEQIPFDETVDAVEEKFWALAAMKRGYRIYSPCSAFYVYLKKFSPEKNMKNDYHQLKTLYRATGIRLGFVNVGAAKTLASLAKGLLVHLPVTLYKEARLELYKAWLRLTFRRDAAKGPHRGSLF